MSVPICIRNGCSNVVFATSSPEHNGLCNSCYDELLCNARGVNIEYFFRTVPGTYSAQESKA